MFLALPVASHATTISDLQAQLQALLLQLSQLSQSQTGAVIGAVDSVSIGCRRFDLDLNGTLNVYDFTKFQKLYSEGNKSTDFDQNGVLNVMDSTAYQTGYAQCSNVVTDPNTTNTTNTATGPINIATEPVIVNNPTDPNTSATGCRRFDMDKNGTLNIYDFTAFHKLFGAGSLLTDIDQNGVLDVRDFPAFQTGYAQCPKGNTATSVNTVTDPNNTPNSNCERFDMDGNKVLNIGDFTRFIKLFSIKSLLADFDRNGILNVQDLTTYQTGFAQCPRGNNPTDPIIINPATDPVNVKIGCEKFDMNEDGKLSIHDFFGFYRFFRIGDKHADVNRDSALDVKDLTAFQTGYALCSK